MTSPVSHFGAAHIGSKKFGLLLAMQRGQPIYPVAKFAGKAQEARRCKLMGFR
jgi:hypothetical protein